MDVHARCPLAGGTAAQLFRCCHLVTGTLKQPVGPVLPPGPADLLGFGEPIGPRLAAVAFGLPGGFTRPWMWPALLSTNVVGPDSS